jgi:hypothetical protein
MSLQINSVLGHAIKSLISDELLQLLWGDQFPSLLFETEDGSGYCMYANSSSIKPVDHKIDEMKLMIGELTAYISQLNMTTILADKCKECHREWLLDEKIDSGLQIELEQKASLLELGDLFSNTVYPILNALDGLNLDNSNQKLLIKFIDFLIEKLKVTNIEEQPNIGKIRDAMVEAVRWFNTNFST